MPLKNQNYFTELLKSSDFPIHIYIYIYKNIQIYIFIYINILKFQSSLLLKNLPQLPFINWIRAIIESQSLKGFKEFLVQ